MTILRPLLVALQFLTCIPISLRSAPSADERRSASAYFPIVGLLIGISGAAVYKGFAALVSAPAAIVLAMLATVMMTGALHEDGLADCADGFVGGHDRDRVLEIMRDSRIGTFGALALAFALLLKFTLLEALPEPLLGQALIVAPTLSRFLVLPLSLALPPARPDGLGKSFAAHVGRRQIVIAVIPTLLVGILLFGLAFVPIAAAACGAVAGFGRYCHRRIGGLTGDCLGAAIQVAEITVFACAAAMFRP